MWDLTQINSSIAEQIRSHELFLVEDHAHAGLDAFREIDLHLVVADGLMRCFDVVLREQCLPSTTRERPTRNARERVDFVLLPERKKYLYDPVDAHKEALRASGTLFKSVATLPSPAPNECDPREAMWIEIKCVPQFRYVDGVPTPNTKYASEIVHGPSEDVVKLASDPLVHHGAVLVIVFNELEEAGPHDLGMSVRAMIDRDLPVGLPEIEQVSIEDRGGNAWCTLGLIPVRT
jgi:hypothetical protein